jgi:hypothetical protein
MKHAARRYKDLKLALNDIEQIVYDPRHLMTGKPLLQFGQMLPRELLGNWLLAATIQLVLGGEICLWSDPTGGDGIIQDVTTGKTWSTEHVYIPQHFAANGADPKTLILDTIKA